MPKISGNVKAFKVENGNEGNKLISFPIDDGNLLEKYKAIWSKIKDLKSIKLNALPVYANRHIKTEIRTNGDNNSTNLYCLNVPEFRAECESFL